MTAMEKELKYFRIGEAYGGNQDWFTDNWMHLGGCAALTACDCCIALEKSGLREGLYPFDAETLCKEDYVKFGMLMKPYLRPRWGGIDRLGIFVDGMTGYLRNAGVNTLSMKTFPCEASAQEAMELVKRQIDSGFPIPFLLLRHKNPCFSQYLWHWFTLVAYDYSEETPMVMAATYGKAEKLPFLPLWDSGYKNNGGMIVFS